MDLNNALTQIAEIRDHIAQSETFRGYRSATVAVSGIFALGGAALQPLVVPDPARQVAAYLRFWISIALASLLIFAAEIVVRSYRNASAHGRRLTLLAVQQFAPCLVAGGLLTRAVVVAAPESAMLLPGLWAVVFSLGIFASCRLLPPPTVWIAAYYLVAGTGAIFWGRDEHAFSPWAMAGTFGVGQLLAAMVLYCTLERSDG